MIAKSAQKRFIRYALERIGSPYIWGGKGEMVWTIDGLKPNGFRRDVFDCSGLVTSALLAAGGPDWRASHSAQKLAENLIEVPGATPIAELLFFGANASHIIHVAICLGRMSNEHGGEIIVDAAGGDSSCKTLEIAAQRNACVRTHINNRKDFVCSGFLWAPVDAEK